MRILKVIFGSFITYSSTETTRFLEWETMKPSSPSRSSIEWVLSFDTRHPFLDSNFRWIQVLNSSLDGPKLRSRCLRELQKVASRCGLLPKSYWIPHSSLAVLDSDFSATGQVSFTRQGLMDGRLVAVKTINPDCITNFNVFKCVRLPPFIPVRVSDGIPPEIAHRCGYLEAITTSERCQFPWVRFRFSSFLPRVPLDGQWEPTRLLAPSSRCW